MGVRPSGAQILETEHPWLAMGTIRDRRTGLGIPVRGAGISDAVAALYPEDPPNFLRRTPYGHHDVPSIGNHLREAGFSEIESTVVTLPIVIPSARHSAFGGLHGSPLGAEVEARNAAGLEAATNAAEAALKARFGDGTMTSTIKAIVFLAA